MMYSPVMGSPQSPKTEAMSPLTRHRAAINVVGAITFFLTSTTSLTFFNKWFLNVSSLHFEFPFAIAAYHQLFAFIFTLMLEKVFLEKLAGPIARKTKYFYLLCPIGLLCAMDWGSSNFSLKTVPLSLYEMIKSTVPMFTLIISIIFGLQPLAPLLIMSIVCICAGTYFSVTGDQGTSAIFTKSFPILGASALLMGSFASGMKAVVSQFVMQKLVDPETGKSDVNGVTMVYYLAPITSGSLGMICAYVEGARLLTYLGQSSGETYFWLFIELTGSATIAFAVTISAFILVRKTSGLAYSVVKIAQRVGIVGLAMLTFGDKVPIANGMGFALSLCGIAMYNYYELIHKHKKKNADEAKNEEEVAVLVQDDSEKKEGYGTAK